MGPLYAQIWSHLGLGLELLPPSHDDEPHVFDELHFTWNSNNTASDPQWERLDDKQAEALTGDILDTLNRRLGDLEFQIEKVIEHELTEAKRTA